MTCSQAVALLTQGLCGTRHYPKCRQKYFDLVLNVRTGHELQSSDYKSYDTENSERCCAFQEFSRMRRQQAEVFRYGFFFQRDSTKAAAGGMEISDCLPPSSGFIPRR
ncbi:uncharacterized protein PHALS_00516 [Plasmopara halstedii]|uniref:Uncharacterized protein n=1 Tax=Plasmopara halstedii TaxID=4781 RepID=A0A0P1A6K4_PLAHL|nr:uncharacterized protein PHALS_00516 [Plasmopara halstedii]CEG36194.1 hypothetical protein PHALS_00516 [Plasmopara halstedii]|eukprot:XP_024572563.1 hypothetical protein PHALS_00516 [Plasmopara halstedii]